MMTTTVLLWGDRWWLPHHKLPIPFADSSQAADMLASAWPEKNKALRLVYLPDDFVTTPVACPNANRATLALALADEHPVVTHPGHVWSHEPILPAHDGFTTLLHYETKPALFALVQQLEQHGFTVSSVWPLATWLNALPPELSESGAMTIVALTPERFCFYRHSANGVRSVQAGQGPDVVSSVASHLRELATPASTEFVLYVTTDDALVERLNERVTMDANHIVGIFSLWEALAKPAVLPARHPAQLLPPVPRITARRAVIAATVLFSVITAATVGSYVHDYRSAQSAGERHDERRQTLMAEIAKLRANADEIASLRGLLARGDPVLCGRFLAELSKAASADVALTSLRLDRSGVAVTGGVAREATAALETWRARLTRDGLPWQLEPLQVSADGFFRLRGTFVR